MTSPDIVLSGDFIIKVQFRDEKRTGGYDLLTEKFCVVKTVDTQKIPKSIINLLKHEPAQYRILQSFLQTDEKIAEHLCISMRTLYRLKEKAF